MARKRGTGARGLRSVIEGLMRDIIFDISGNEMRGMKVVIDEKRVLSLDENGPPLEALRLERTDEEVSEVPEPEAQPDVDDEASSGETAAWLKD